MGRGRRTGPAEHRRLAVEADPLVPLCPGARRPDALRRGGALVLPLVTTTGSVLRPADGDPYETAAAPTVVATGIAAHVSSPTGSEVDAGGQLERIDAVLLTEADTDLRHTDLWRDDGTGDVYRVAWLRL